MTGDPGRGRPAPRRLASGDVLDRLGRVRDVGAVRGAHDETRHVDVEARDVGAAGNRDRIDADPVEARGVGAEVGRHDFAHPVGERRAGIRARSTAEREDVVGGTQVVGHAASLRRG
ncbi:hypothetical protein NKG05_11750 [Oerskovia sp. M15]